MRDVESSWGYGPTAGEAWFYISMGVSTAIVAAYYGLRALARRVRDFKVTRAHVGAGAEI